jgi:hypothetical protein
MPVGRIDTAEGMRTLLFLLALTLMTTFEAAHAASPSGDILTLRTRTAVFGVDARGAFSTLAIRGQGDYLAAGQPAPLLSVSVDGKLVAPDRATWDAKSRRLTLRYDAAGVTATLAAEAKPTHVVYKVVGLEPAGRAELAVWGPFPTRIRGIVGETVGVVRDGAVAIGLQSLNPKTIGGYPDHANDDDQGFGGDDNGAYANLPAELTKEQGWRGATARPMPYGSLLQAYCRDRSRARTIANWGSDRYVAPALQDGGIVGSAIALFACPAAKALDAIGIIEVAEGLPHPMIDGVWGKESPGATASYLIVDFSEENVDRAIEMTRRAGLKYLYHSSPFAAWGHFQLKPELFPHGWDGLKACVDKARAAGIRIGFHTLSNFITPNDPYVTPVPDPRLARVGTGELAAAIDANQTEIPVTAPELFAKPSALNAVMIDHELIKYTAVSAQPPWRLTGCQRGAWGAHAADHAQTASVARLADHSYNVFLGDAALSREVAQNIARLFNHVGALQTSFDGLEGNQSTGLGEYGRTLFVQAWYDALSPELKGHVINDASNPGHYNWHINTRMNWGEPWYAGFRESQTLYRFKNQVYFERNFMPHMLGWFALRPDTSIEDAEWLLARAAGFDAGFTIAASLASTAQLAADPASAETSKRYGAILAILEAVRQWETARMSGAFPAQVKALLRDNAREFHLEPVGKSGWNLYEAHGRRFTADLAQGATAGFDFQTADAEQPLLWTIHSTAKEPVRDLKVLLNGRQAVALKGLELPPGASVRYSGGADAVIYDSAWKELARVPVDTHAARLGAGSHRLELNWADGPLAGNLKIEARTLAPAIRLQGKARKP